MSVETEDAFQKELVELFVQEAQEWLQQIHVALDELQQSPPLDRHLALIQTIKVGLTNLGGSAATLSLGDVERASFSTLPFVEAVQDPAVNISIEDFIMLCKQLGHIHRALTSATGVTFDAEAVTASTEDPPMIATKDFLTLLRGLQAGSTATGRSHRNLLQTMVTQAEGLMHRGMEQCNVASIQEFLDRLAEGEQAFLQFVRQELPHLTTVLDSLQNRTDSGPSSLPDLQNAVERTAQLWSTAQQVNAPQAMSFFMGLNSFLTIVTQPRVMVGTKHYEAVRSRLSQSVASIEEWAESGRTERLAIQSALRH